MHPAFSVIFFTTLIGVGQGLFLALYAGELLTRFGDIGAPDGGSFYALGSAISVLFLGIGLAASFLHLGRPERAWRAAAMWRTSWLSREVIALPACIALLALWWLAWWSGRAAQAQALWLPLLALAAAALLWVCTGMIYACIR